MKKGWYWPWFVGALLLATATSQGWMIWTATHDSTVSLVPDYYQKGVAFDTVIAQEGTNARLGWRAALSVASLAADGGDVTVRLTDASGVPLPGARVQVTGIHNLDGDRHVTQALADRADGSYVARLPLDRTGLWEFQVDVVRGADHFTADAHVDVTGTPRLAPPAR
ncbi:MAG: FixH family protein [Gemmatimonadetes bacterium]|nr:FixH family protein [Gemmatimonadota bacterium]